MDDENQKEESQLSRADEWLNQALDPNSDNQEEQEEQNEEES